MRQKKPNWFIYFLILAVVCFGFFAIQDFEISVEKVEEEVPVSKLVAK